MPRDNDDDRPKKSWREIDNAREKGQARRDSPAAGRTERSQAYRSYKTQLNKLFDGGALPEALQSKLADAPVASAAKSRKEMAAKILEATLPKAIKAAVKAYTEAFEFPEDEEVLAKLLDLSDEALVLQAIQTLDRKHGDGGLKRGASLKARLKTAQLTLDDPDIRSAAAALLGKL